MLFSPVRYFSLSIAVFLLLASSCKNTTNQNENFQYTQEVPDSPQNKLAPAELACLQTMGRICEAGILPGFRGMKMDSVKFVEGNGIRVTDSIAREGGYEWRVRRVDDPDGRLTFESQPVDEGDPAKKLPKADLLRVLIEHPGFSTAEGVHLGTTLAELTEIFGDNALTAIAIPSYGKVQLSVEGSRILYMIDDPGQKLAALADKRYHQVPLRKIPQNVKISMIVAMLL